MDGWMDAGMLVDGRGGRRMGVLMDRWVMNR
jgi:hypothetical protein